MARNKRIKKKILKVISDVSPKELSLFYKKEISKLLKSKEVTFNGVPVIHPGFMD